MTICSPVVAIDNGVNMIFCVRADAYDELVSLRDDSHDVSEISCDADKGQTAVAGASPGKITSEQYYDESRFRRERTTF